MKMISSMSVLVVPLLSGMALAEGPSYEQTTQYITERCQGVEGGVAVNRHKMVAVAFDQAQVILSKTSTGSSSKFSWRTKFDLRDVNINRHEADRGQGRGIDLGVAFTCGDNCIVVQTSSFTGKTLDGPPKDHRWPDDWLFCREADKVLKAFRHLQTLVGGKKQDLFGD
ncbi:hypothetical protein [Kordiimonas sp.]|uniref:hypothetical protein n=1 Tax=Kordiimonas sp. TaxID=1970157 RepID=UPI003A91927F